jgi:hypothetical protein
LEQKCFGLLQHFLELVGFHFWLLSNSQGILFPLDKTMINWHLLLSLLAVAVSIQQQAL